LSRAQGLRQLKAGRLGGWKVRNRLSLTEFAKFTGKGDVREIVKFVDGVLHEERGNPHAPAAESKETVDMKWWGL
jgi:hypothetical protein